MKKDTEELRNKKWGNRSLITGMISLFLSLCTVPISGVPLGIPCGIFAIAFAIISKDDRIRGNAVAGIITGGIGIKFADLYTYIICFVSYPGSKGYRQYSSRTAEVPTGFYSNVYIAIIIV